MQTYGAYIFTRTNREYMGKCAEEFENRWGFPNCIGSVDGKHVTVKRPNNSGSNYWCYLHKYSIVLMAKI
ncbi:unnamed protein product [Acanthoscelides obtectus]|uniref:DDE Tnp4 domain-containing protein n=1 Tax=Acanthoscelides obtectus TaxID=200917 RepID=A0A9P0LC41_ACAOB|nr:unnamed protein product [Acanthoscelides obtectus]CAK1646525.1 hypothetical protein AOBTE_LOCUS14689 [Acanthoscelides obtectus]